jgi:DNA-binding NarL/FixJ family response regulator
MQVVLATSRPYLCDSLCLYLSTRKVEIVGTADSIASLLTQALTLRPDAVVLDKQLAGSFLGVTVDALQAGAAPIPIVLLSHRSEAEETEPEIQVDAYGTIGDPPEILLSLLEEMSRRQRSWAPGQNLRGLDHPR